MNYSSQYQEYSARYGLKSSHNNIDIAQQLAEAKYRTLMGREILFSEMLNINQFIKELNSWNNSTKTLPEETCAH